MDAAFALNLCRIVISTAQCVPLAVQCFPCCMSAQFLSGAVWAHKEMWRLGDQTSFPLQWCLQTSWKLGTTLEAEILMQMEAYNRMS